MPEILLSVCSALFNHVFCVCFDHIAFGKIVSYHKEGKKKRTKREIFIFRFIMVGGPSNLSIEYHYTLWKKERWEKKRWAWMDTGYCANQHEVECSFLSIPIPIRICVQ